MNTTIRIPHHFVPPAAEYRDLSVDVPGDPGTRRIVHLYVIDPERKGGSPALQFAETREDVPAGAVYIDYWEVRFPAE
ncbi:MAG TPA: hypothetical protein VF151_10135 [Gemmatimonadales bacterium]